MHLSDIFMKMNQEEIIIKIIISKYTAYEIRSPKIFLKFKEKNNVLSQFKKFRSYMQS